MEWCCTREVLKKKESRKKEGKRNRMKWKRNLDGDSERKREGRTGIR